MTVPNEPRAQVAALSEPLNARLAEPKGPPRRGTQREILFEPGIHTNKSLFFFGPRWLSMDMDLIMRFT